VTLGASVCDSPSPSSRHIRARGEGQTDNVVRELERRGDGTAHFEAESELMLYPFRTRQLKLVYHLVDERLACAGLSSKPSDGLEPLTPLYEEGPCVKLSVVGRRVRAGAAVVDVELDSSLYRLLWEDKADWSSLRWRISLRAVRRPGGRWRLWERRVARG
jgi:hypothetical protein